MDLAYYSDILQSIAILVLALLQYKWIKDTIAIREAVNGLTAYLNDSQTAVEKITELMIQQRSDDSSSTPPTV